MSPIIAAVAPVAIVPPLPLPPPRPRPPHFLSPLPRRRPRHSAPSLSANKAQSPPVGLPFAFCKASCRSRITVLIHCLLRFACTRSVRSSYSKSGTRASANVNQGTGQEPLGKDQIQQFWRPAVPCVLACQGDFHLFEIVARSFRHEHPSRRVEYWRENAHALLSRGQQGILPET